MTITLTSSSTPTSMEQLNAKLSDKGGLQGLMNKTVKHSLLKTGYFDLSLVTPPKGQPHYLVQYFCVASEESKTATVNTYEEAQALLEDIFAAREAYHAAM